MGALPQFQALFYMVSNTHGVWTEVDTQGSLLKELVIEIMEYSTLSVSITSAKTLSATISS